MAKRKPNAFYKELRELRAKVGLKEYNRDQKLLPLVIDLLEKHGTTREELLRDEANSVLDNVEASDESASEGLFSDEAHVPLGEKQRIQRSSMAMDQINRRKRVIDRNKMAQDTAWAFETTRLEADMDLLESRPAGTTVRQARKLKEKEGV